LQISQKNATHDYKGWVLKIRVQRLQGPILKVRIILFLLIRARAVAMQGCPTDAAPFVSSCLYRESTPRSMHAHQIGIP